MLEPHPSRKVYIFYCFSCLLCRKHVGLTGVHCQWPDSLMAGVNWPDTVLHCTPEYPVVDRTSQLVVLIYFGLTALVTYLV